MFSEGLVLLAMGMGIVFAFLYLMVLLMRGIAIFIPQFNHLMPDDVPKTKTVRAPRAAADESVVIAVAIAVARARQRGPS